MSIGIILKISSDDIKINRFLLILDKNVPQGEHGECVSSQLL